MKEKTSFPVPDTLKDADRVYKGTRFDIVKIGKREAVVHPGAVVILPLFDKDHLVMIRNERFAVGETLLELPAGTLEPGEAPQTTAERELIEETGYQAESMKLLMPFYPTPGFCTERMYAYVAKDLSFVGQDLDETEKITVEIVSWRDALNLVKDGTIRDAKTIVTLLYYNTFK